jgi:hypothetical protein
MPFPPEWMAHHCAEIPVRSRFRWCSDVSEGTEHAPRVYNITRKFVMRLPKWRAGTTIRHRSVTGSAYLYAWFSRQGLWMNTWVIDVHFVYKKLSLDIRSFLGIRTKFRQTVLLVILCPKRTWNEVHSASWVQLRSYLEEKVAAPSRKPRIGPQGSDMLTTWHPPSAESWH